MDKFENAYQETIEWLFSQLPMYQRQGKAAYKADLSSTIQLMQVLKNPERDFKSIHVGGTNGKGSVSHMLASILQEAGYKVGLYTSPHLKDFRERIRINGKKISKEEVVTFVNEHKATFSRLGLSFFEWTVGLAFKHFSNQKVDIAIIEVGMGGRLDSTNVILPELSVITNISLDHVQFLGDTLEKIAIEKAGIIKREKPIVIGKTQFETKPIFEEKATRLNAPISFADQSNFPEYEIDLKGNYQLENRNTVLAAIQILNSQKHFSIAEESIRDGLAKVTSNTNLLGRWQILNHSPLIVADTAHNVSGLQNVFSQIEKTPFDKLHFVFGTLVDKDLEDILSLLPRNALYYACAPDIQRALPSKDLNRLLKESGFESKEFNSVPEAFEATKSNANENDMIYIGGSTFVVAKVL